MEIVEAIELKPWLFKIRATNRRKWYTLTKRKDSSFHCTCPSFLYNTDKCKHIKLLEMIVE